MTDTTIGQTLPCANTRREVNNRLTTGRRKRALVGGAGILALMGASLAASCAAPAPAKSATRTSDRSAWDNAHAAWRKAKRAADRANAGYDRAGDRWKATFPSSEHIDLAAFPRTLDHNRVLYSLDLDDFERAFSGSVPRHRDEKDRLLRAIVQVREWRLLRRQNDARHRIPDWEDLVNRVDDVLADAEKALMAVPSPDAAALLWKVEQLFEDNGTDSMIEWRRSYMLPILHDVRRFAQEGR